MINIYTSYKYFGSDINVIRDFESFFIAYVPAREFTEEDISVIDEIDHAQLIDKNLGTVRTPFGVTSINNLSTGCKTVLSYLFIKRHSDKYRGIVLDVTECGWNALECLFKQMEKLEDNDTLLVLQHQDKLFKCSQRDYRINGKDIVKDLGIIMCNSKYI